VRGGRQKQGELLFQKEEWAGESKNKRRARFSPHRVPPFLGQLNFPAKGDYFAQIIYSASQRSLAMHKFLPLLPFFVCRISIRNNRQSFKVNTTTRGRLCSFAL
jgi:hypothetical protein